MDHFEELGLTRSAGSTEIRQAYKVLAGLLHPDRQRGEAQRKLAGIQMARLNTTVEMLLDEKRRREYEAQLDNKVTRASAPPVIVVPPPPAAEPWRAMASGRGAAIFAAGAVFASILWWAADSGRSMEAPAVPAPAADLRARVAELENRLGEVEREQAAPARHAARAPVATGLAGVWYYDAATGSRRIDMTITNDAGVMHGSYRSQGNPLAGQPENPVAFEFSGKSDGEQARLPWAGGAGNGEIEMRLVGKDTLETRWWSYSTEKAMGDNYGTAVLRRRRNTP